MTGSDNEGGASVSQADLASFRQDTANEIAQFQSALQRTLDDIVNATRRPNSGEGTNGAGGLGSQLGGSANGAPLPNNGFPGAALPGQPIDSGPGGAGTPGPPQPGQAGELFTGPGGGYGYGGTLGGAGASSALLGPAGGIAAGPGVAVGYRGAGGAGGYGGACDGVGARDAAYGQVGRLPLGSGAGLGYGGALGGAAAAGALHGQVGGLAVGSGGVVGYGGALGGTGAPSAPYGWPGGLAAGGQMGGLAGNSGGGAGYGGVLGGAGAHGQPGGLAVGGQMGGLAVNLGGGGGYGGALGGASAHGAPYGQPGGLAGGPGGGFGQSGAMGGAGAAGAPPIALGHYYDRPGAPVGRARLGDGGASEPSTALGKQISKIVTARAVTSWGHPTTRLWQVICGGRPASMQKAALQGYVGDAVDISARVHTMLESLDAIDFLAFVPRGGAGAALSLSQHLCIMGHAIVTVAYRGLPQDAADLSAARARVEALRVAFEVGAKLLNNHVMEHYAIANSRGNRARLADLVRKDLETFTLELRAVSDFCGHRWAYPPAVSAFPDIPGPRWPRLDAYIKSGGLINADVLQPVVGPTIAPASRFADGECRQWGKNGKCRFGTTCIFKHVGPARTGGTGTKRGAATGGGSADGGTAAGGVVAAELPAKKAKGKGKAGAAGSGGGSGSGGGGSGSGGGGSSSGGSGSGGGGSGSGASGAGASTRSAAAKANE